MISFFSNIFGYVLNIIYEIVKNYGLAIILFSILLKILLLPLTIKPVVKIYDDNSKRFFPKRKSKIKKEDTK